MNETQKFINAKERGARCFGEAMMSFDEATGVQAKAYPSQDALMIDAGSEIYAVFDGVGACGEGAARDASRAAARILSTLLVSEYGFLFNEPRLMLDYVSEEIAMGLSENTLTVGTLVKVLDVGRDKCAWKGASVGDVRVYLVAHDGCCSICKQLTTDEVDESNNLTNVLGATGEHHVGRTKHSFFGEIMFKPNEWIEVSLNGGRPFSVFGLDEGALVWLVILTDGVYANLEEPDEAIAKAVYESTTPTEAAHRLVNSVAVAKDDRTAVVVKLR